MKYEVSFNLTEYKGIYILESLDMKLDKKNKDLNYHWSEWSNSKGLTLESQYNPYNNINNSLGFITFKSKSRTDILSIEKLMNNFIKYMENKKHKIKKHLV